MVPSPHVLQWRGSDGAINPDGRQFAGGDHCVHRLDHTSILQFIEHTFTTKQKPLRLSTIAQARRELYDLTKAFDFTQEPNNSNLPTTTQLLPTAKQTILALNLERTLADCSTNLPIWLIPLLEGS